MITPKQRAVIEAARRKPARFLEIPPRKVEDRLRKEQERRGAEAVSKLLAREQRRLMKTWSE